MPLWGQPPRLSRRAKRGGFTNAGNQRHHQRETVSLFDDHGLIDQMREVTISEFKANCFSLLNQVQKTKQPLRVTRFGRPIAEIVPIAPQPSRADWFGSMKDSIEILGDIISPANDEQDWEVLRD
jgi:prevent-host-death family protein